jgi:hypothetical protein
VKILLTLALAAMASSPLLAQQPVDYAKTTQDLDARWAPRDGFLSGDVITRMAFQSSNR